MTHYQREALELLEAQQSGVEPRSPQWMVGEQLKGIALREPGSAELLAQDLEKEAMSITEAEKKIKAFADGHKTGNFACVTPAEAERILRKFYGLTPPEGGGDRSFGAKAENDGPGTGEARPQGFWVLKDTTYPEVGSPPPDKIIDLMDFL